MRRAVALVVGLAVGCGSDAETALIRGAVNEDAFSLQHGRYELSPRARPAL